MSSTSGPIVPLRTGSEVVRPDSGFLCSKFLLFIRAVLKSQTAGEPRGQPGSVTWSARGIKARATTRRGCCSLGRYRLEESQIAQLERRGLTSAGAGDSGVLLAELVHAARGVHHLLLAGIKRMAVGADVEAQIMPDGRARLETVPAAAGNGDFFVLRMEGGFHDSLPEWT